jgi:hypothetical protein
LLGSVELRRAQHARDAVEVAVDLDPGAAGRQRQRDGPLEMLQHVANAVVVDGRPPSGALGSGEVVLGDHPVPSGRVDEPPVGADRPLAADLTLAQELDHRAVEESPPVMEVVIAHERCEVGEAPVQRPLVLHSRPLRQRRDRRSTERDGDE